ncbi:hypothetical protein SBA4_1300001 [Candidatus Sulfopaludibacter sp. SbA4]|nr:hypothetical protein SBA4_1300001 [Candidatus Sulfopaludibacter sp. SbA4]
MSEKFVAAAGASPTSGPVYHRALSGRQWFEPYPRGITRLMSTRPRRMPDSLMTQCFTITPGIVGPRSQLSPRRCSVQTFLRPYEEISTTAVQRFLARKITVRRGSVERNSLPNSIVTDRVNSSYPSFEGWGGGDLLESTPKINEL